VSCISLSLSKSRRQATTDAMQCDATDATTVLCISLRIDGRLAMACDSLPWLAMACDSLPWLAMACDS